VLTRGRDLQEGMQVIKAFSPLGNVILLERPLSAITLCTTVQAALRTRRRQYQVRDLIEEQKRAAEALRSSRQEVMELNADLEQRVAHRTAELSAANSELEAFCYSVSHDLRAPLRAIDGFALTVLDHCNGSLDETARSYIDRARKAAHRMQRLIDDLLGLSRLSRAQMTFDHVDLTSLANSVIHELRQGDPERAVEVRVGSGLKVWGDAALLRIALDNLLSNAWKFTARREGPMIEFGSMTEKGVSVFFVRDNGAGFDMAYSSKLFVPFQRLHTNHDFQGSGIGLAIVQRIIRRHEGDIWADGKPGQGASFYFRLPIGSASPREGGQINSEVTRLNVEDK
jgi:light-regulated signal transduction histidine kinase (bacteriophytochrome)